MKNLERENAQLEKLFAGESRSARFGRGHLVAQPESLGAMSPCCLYAGPYGADYAIYRYALAERQIPAPSALAATRTSNHPSPGS
jgi:hypothetical protein